MYIQAKDGTETTSFFLNSTIISKIAPDSTGDYENIEITSPVTSLGDKLYINVDGFMQGFNSVLAYDAEEKTVTVQTLPYLVKYYESNITNYGYSAISEELNNQKALIYGMIVASKDSTKKYGVIDSATGDEIISPRYNKIEFVENSKEFIITNSSDKVGIAYKTGKTKIDALYDEIKTLDKKLGYYLVKSNSKYGVINSEGQTVIYIEYDEIGLDTTKFPADNIKNQYLLYDSVIPVRLNQKWGFFDKNGNRITEMEYDNIGCINKDMKDKVTNNTAIISDTEIIVVAKDGKYGGIDTKGELILPLIFENVYSITSSGETTYYMTYNGNDGYKAVDYINARRAQLESASN